MSVSENKSMNAAYMVAAADKSSETVFDVFLVCLETRV
ncbi:hypothetical protein NEIFL0001_1913 [Neisseria flavescens SK114]|jgi:hypothetical protein|nr:hypothetical protein NEIFL0001_1913 [Neisseria flavescens SK114]